MRVRSILKGLERGRGINTIYNLKNKRKKTFKKKSHLAVAIPHSRTQQKNSRGQRKKRATLLKDSSNSYFPKPERVVGSQY